LSLDPANPEAAAPVIQQTIFDPAFDAKARARLLNAIDQVLCVKVPLAKWRGKPFGPSPWPLSCQRLGGVANRVV
jgi:hypothetical protein